jgi:hypothetical protein
MAKGDLLGHIDCPSCGTVKGMRVTLDKNDHPFGYCEVKCSQQLRIGGDAYRVKEFYAKYPHLLPKTGTDTDTGPEPAEEPKQEPQPVKKTGMSSALEAFGIN